jgi:hypothetical protein
MDKFIMMTTTTLRRRITAGAYDPKATIDKAQKIKELQDIKMMLGDDDFRTYVNEMLPAIEAERVETSKHKAKLETLNDQKKKLERRQELQDVLDDIKTVIVKGHTRSKSYKPRVLKPEL